MIKYVFNLEPSPKDDRDYLLESIYPESVTLPKTYDLREELPPVRDQGTQGTCSAQAAACMKEWQEHVDVNFKNHMSPQFVYNLRSNQGSAGMMPRDTMKILNNIGIVPEKDYPYNTRKKINEGLKLSAGKFKIIGYAQIGTIDSLKKALIANGPCYIAFPVFNATKKEFWKPDFANQPSMGGHAVTVVGWTLDSFIIRNSWSSAWGDRGYTYLKFTDWGMQWECWTTLDEDSNPEGLLKKLESRGVGEKIGFFKRLFCKKIRNKK